MIYVVGTGRCGTGSMAVKLKGLHEPEPRLMFPFRMMYEGEWDSYKQVWLKRTLESRMRLDTPAISDCYQSLFITDIAKVDLSAEFIWLVRERGDCVRSMAQRRHNYFWRNLDVAGEFYDIVNNRIRKSLQGLRYEKISTEDIGEPVLNVMNKPLIGSDFR